jgi:hypothetical protein
MRRLFLLALFCSCAHAGVDRPLSAEAPAEGAPAPVVVTGSIDVASNDVEGLVHAVRARVQAVRGQVMNEEVSGIDAPHARLRVRLPPLQVASFSDWLAGVSHIRERHLGAADVTRDVVDEEAALHSLRTTLKRLEELAAHGGALADVLAIEKELTRVRGELERVEGAHRQLLDAAALATLELTVAPAAEALAPHALFELVPSASLLGFVDGRGRPVRAGGGVSLMFGRGLTLELQLFPVAGAQPRAGLVTLQTGVYSDFFGGGRRRFANPYLGLLAGGGSVGGHGVFTAGGTAGLEIVRAPRLFVAAEARAQLLLYHQGVGPADVGLQATLSAGVPF